VAKVGEVETPRRRHGVGVFFWARRVVSAELFQWMHIFWNTVLQITDPNKRHAARCAPNYFN
jgi:hypothetical protein